MIFLKKIAFSLIILLTSLTGKTQLFINEVSQGTGNPPDEFIELVVVGNGSCTDTCADIRGWVIDDNNGFFGITGIAKGHVRFSHDAQWGCVPYGSLIVIYSNITPYTGAISDPTDANGDQVYILNPTSNLLENDPNLPSSSTTASTGYTGGIYTAGGGTWNHLAMKNSGDIVHIVSPTDLNISFQSIGWGTASGTTIHFAGAASDKAFLMENIVDNNPMNQANWTDGGGTVYQVNSPGSPNNAANAAWINSLRINGASPSSYDSITACQGDSIQLNGNWYFKDTTITELFSNGTCDSAVYHVLSFTQITTPNINGDTWFCIGDQTTLVVDGTYDTYNWSNGETVSSATFSSAGNYIVLVTSNGCSANDSVQIEQVNCDSICMPYIPNAITLNNDNYNDQFKIEYSPTCDFNKEQLLIYTRWGEKIFESESFNEIWDGKYKNELVKQGIYIYKATYRIEGTSEDIIKFGTIAIIK